MVFLRYTTYVVKKTFDENIAAFSYYVLMCEPPQNYNSTYSCWSYSLLHRVIKSVYCKEISFSCVYSNLKKLGTKLIKPTKVLAKASQEKIDQYNAELKSLHDKFNDETDVLYYHDECGINLDPKKYGKV